jgi:transposase
VIDFYDHQLSEIDAAICSVISSDSELSGLFALLTGVKGVGLCTACDLMSGLPELGRISKREISSLVGVAPMNCDSGGQRGQRHIRGGRLNVRCSLYMACLSGIRSNSVIRCYYNRLREEGKKPFKVAIVACMRKLLLHMNSICAQNYA